MPAVLLAAAAVVGDSGWSGALYSSVVLALTVIVIETLRDVDRYRALRQKADARAMVASREAQRLQAGELPLDKKRQLELFAYVGDKTPTLVEMLRTGGEAQPAGRTTLDSWLSMISDRVQHTAGTAHAGIMVLRETVKRIDGEFVARYEVMNRGGSRECTLSVGVLVRVREDLAQDLRREAEAGSVHVVDFSVNQERYWICISLSSSTERQYLTTLARMMVSPVAPTLASRLSLRDENASDLSTVRRTGRLNPRPRG